jgi:O-antigen/teichoic acid export membrane protein
MTRITAQAGALTTVLRDLWRQWQERAPLPMHVNSVAIMLSVVAAGAFGQVTWLLAARLSSPHEVGIASAYMSGALLCAQVSLLGLGSAVIALLPRYRRQPVDLLTTLLTTVAVAGLVAGGAYVLIAVTSLRELGAFVSEPGAVVVVLAQAILLPVAVMFDQSAVALRRADGVLIRSVVGGIFRVGLIVTLWLLASPDGLRALSITLAWVGATLLACLLGNRQMRQVLPDFKFRPTVKREFVSMGLAVGLPNHFVSLVMIGPGLIISILVAELLSPTLNAYWYVAWMLAGIVFVVPSSNGLALFAEVSNHPERLRQGISSCVRSSLLFGLPLAIGMAVAADWLLPLLGDGYRAGITPMRLMAAAVLPMTFVETYVATCRALRRLAEPAITCAIAGLATIAAAAGGGLLFGLNGVAVSWLAVQTVVGIWAAWRLRTMLARSTAHSDVLRPAEEGWRGALEAPLTLARDADRRL